MTNTPSKTIPTPAADNMAEVLEAKSRYQQLLNPKLLMVLSR